MARKKIVHAVWTREGAYTDIYEDVPAIFSSKEKAEAFIEKQPRMTKSDNNEWMQAPASGYGYDDKKFFIVEYTLDEG